MGGDTKRQEGRVVGRCLLEKEKDCEEGIEQNEERERG